MLDPSSMNNGEKAFWLARLIGPESREGAVRLWLQLFGAAPCGKCGYRKKFCRCNQKRKIPRRTWTDPCRDARAERLARMDRLH